MQKKFIFNLALILVLNLLVKPFYILGIDAEVQNQVGTANYGVYFSLLNLTFLFNVILDFGLVNYNTKKIAENPTEIQSFFSKLLTIRFLLFGLYFSTVIISGLIMGYSKNQLYLLLLLIINQFFIATIQFLRSNITGLHWFKAEALMSVLDRILLIIFCSILLWTNFTQESLKIEWFVYAQMLAYFITALIGFLILKSKIHPFKFQYSSVFSLSIIKKSFPYALLIFLMFMYNRIDSVMLERMLPNGKIQAGIYAQGFRYLDAINMFALLFAGLLLPIYSRLIKQKKNIYQMVETPFRILIPASIVLGITCFFYSELIMGFRYTNYISESAISFSILIISFIPISLTYIYGTLLTANGSLKALNIMAVFGVIINISLNLILIPKLEAYGAAIATLITQSITAFIQVIIAYRVFKFKFNYRLLLGMISFTICIIGINLTGVKQWLGLPIEYTISNFLITLLFSGLLVFVFQIIKIRYLKRFFEYNNL